MNNPFKSLNLFTSSQKWSFLGLICALTIFGVPSFLYSSEEQTQQSKVKDAPVESSLSVYELHLPPEIYARCLNQQLLNKSSVREIKNSEGAHGLSIRVEEEDGRQFVTVTYLLDKPIDHVKAVQLIYRVGILMSYLIFDEEGKDFISRGPFTNEHEIEMNDFLLYKVLPIFQ